MEFNTPQSRLWLPVDVSDAEKAKRLIGDARDAGVENFKIGLELLMALGAPAAFKLVNDVGGNIWCDGKFPDIPNTTAGAARAVVAQGVKVFNLHISAEMDAMIDAVAVKGSALCIGVTVLTSLTEEQCQLTFGGSIRAAVLKFARNAKLAGCDGIVCAPGELAFLGKRRELNGLVRFTPNIRPGWYETADDQNKDRGMTPADAIKAGATALVIGRPITKPLPNMTGKDSVRRIIDEIASAMN